MKARTPILLTAMVALVGLATGPLDAQDQITLTDIYDNYLYKDGASINREVFLGPHWGLACFDVVETTIQELQSLGVRKAAPSHCTGDQAVASFKAEYGPDFVAMGVGQTIRVAVDPVVAVTVAPESVVVGSVVD